jgi:UDP-2,3-diacylglucosamine hydrolase
MNKTYFFISDIHLGLEAKESEDAKEAKLVSFLYSIMDKADELFIVGDLFDYWFEYKRVYQKGYFRTFTALQDLTRKGIKIHYFIGNHDFLHRDFFPKELGVKLYSEGEYFTLNDKKFYIAHGDGLIANDLGYKILKKVLRNDAAQWLYSKIHPDLGIRIASGSSKSSRKYTAQKNYGDQNGLFEVSKKYIDAGCDYVLFGHSHKKDLLPYNKGFYINLGSWLDEPCYGVFKDTDFSIVDWK